jgi:hypothetical protein
MRLIGEICGNPFNPLNQWQSNLIWFAPLQSTDCHASLRFARNDGVEGGYVCNVQKEK